MHFTLWYLLLHVISFSGNAQVCLEGEISRQSILNSLSRGKKASGDLIPWTVSEQVRRNWIVKLSFVSEFLTAPFADSSKIRSLAACLEAEWCESL